MVELRIEDSARQYIEQMVMAHRTIWKNPRIEEWAYCCPEELVLKEGREFDVSDAIVTPGTPKQCFWNARRKASLHGWTYCEGFAHSGILVVMHGWCLDKKGRLREVTWKTAGLSYFGIELRLDEVPVESPYLDDWKNGYPQLKTKRGVPDAARVCDVPA